MASNDQEQEIIKQMKNIINNVPGAVCYYEWMNETLVPIIISKKYSEMIGCDGMKSIQETEGIAFKHVHPDDLVPLQKACLDAIYKTHKLNYTYRSRNEKTGEYLWINVQANIIEENEKKYAYASYTDVSKEMEDRQKSEIWYRKQIDLISQAYPDALGSLVINITKDYVTNQTRFYNYIPEKTDNTLEKYLLGLKSDIPEPDFGEYSAFIAKEHLLEAYANGEDELQMIHRYKFKDKMRWVKVIVRILPNPLTGDLEAYVFAIDNSEQILSEQVRQKLVDLRYDVVALIYVEDGHVDFRYSGNEFEGLPEISIDEYEKNREASAKLYGKEQGKNYLKYTEMKLILEELEKCGSYAFNILFMVGDKTTYKRYTYNYLSEEKDIIFVTIQDISDVQHKEEIQIQTIQAALAEAERANNAKSAFLSNMSHDIRTPMNAIINMTKMAQEDIEEPEKVMEDLKKIEVSSSFLLALVNDVLDMAKINSGKMELHPETYMYEEFINYIDSVFTPLCVKKGIQFIMNRGTTDLALYVDTLRFNQMFFNIISNAVKYTAPGGTVTYDIQNNKVENGYLICDYIISDTGQGMSKEFQKKMFEPFSREDNRDIKQTGTGLGLSIVKSTVDLMGGTIQVESELGKGSKFIIHLSQKIATKEQIAEKTQKYTRAINVSLEGKHILVAEDHPINRDIIKRLLERKGIIADMAENGNECIARLQEQGKQYYDAILMDIRMPIMDGLDATKKIRQLDDSYTKNIPIIAMTANAFAEDKEMAKKAGMTEYLAKPIDAKELYSILGTQILGN